MPIDKSTTEYSMHYNVTTNITITTLQLLVITGEKRKYIAEWMRGISFHINNDSPIGNDNFIINATSYTKWICLFHLQTFHPL
jgi:hypothetical protein